MKTKDVFGWLIACIFLSIPSCLFIWIGCVIHPDYGGPIWPPIFP